MAGGKLSARQKMINMMYLVLTALLALNVSKEILKAFHLMEVSFNKANANVDKKNISNLTKNIDKLSGLAGRYSTRAPAGITGSSNIYVIDKAFSRNGTRFRCFCSKTGKNGAHSF